MKTKSQLALALIASALVAAALAQRPPAGGAVVVSEPGKAEVASAAEVSAQVVGIDKATRTVTLKGPEGNVFDVVGVDPAKSTITLKGPRGSEETLRVGNPDQFKVVRKGDQVEVTYSEALALSVEAAPKPAAKK